MKNIYAGQLLKLREFLMNSRMAIYIDERTLADIAKTYDEEDLEAGEEAEDNDRVDDYEREFFEQPKAIRKKTEYVKSVKTKECVRLATVDNFQGEEAEVVLISTVRCNDRGSTGFLKISNRVNVMMSRAKHGMYVFGSAATISNCKRATVFNSILEDFQDNKRIGEYLPLKCSRHTTKFNIKTPDEFERIVPDGGCNLPCGTRLLCGHACPRMCHPDDANHLGTACNEPCVRLHKACGHPCMNLCHQDCGNCLVKVECQLPCGHIVKSVNCYQALSPDTIMCHYPVEAEYPLCGHKCKLTCSKATALLRRIQELQEDDARMSNDREDPLFGCTQQCNTTLQCTHTCSRPCGKCCAATVSDLCWLTLEVVEKTQHATACSSTCKRNLLCGHSCAGVCHGATECPPCKLQCAVTCPHTSCSEPCPSCALPCVWSCTHSGECPLPCGSPCIRLPCDERCDKLLACNHPCPSVCGEVCPPVAVGCKICVSEERKAAIVDYVEMTTMEQHDASTDPLLALGCGHIFTVSTIDGVVGINDVYSKDKSGKWNGVLPLPSKCGATPQCPSCRLPIANVRRILSHIALEQASIKFRLKIEREAHRYISQITEKEQVLQKFEEDGLHDPSAVNFKTLKQAIERTSSLSEELCRTVDKEQPELRAYEKAVVALQNNALASIVATRTLVRVFLMRFRVMVVEYHHALKYYGEDIDFLDQLAGQDQQSDWRVVGKKPPLPTSAYDSLSAAALDFVTKLEHLALFISNRFEVLLNLCRTSNSNKSLVEILQLAIAALYTIISNTRKVIYARRVPQITAQATETIESRVSLTVQYLEELSAIAPSEAIHSQDLLKRIVKMVRTEFYEEVTKREKLQIFQAMSRDVGSGVGSFGGHWYTCPNGHVYTIGECGGAMEASSCPECGLDVGGSNHRITTGRIQ